MSSNDLKDAVKEMLIEDGHYCNLKAELERIVVEKLVGEANNAGHSQRPDDVQLADALVLEYLSWRGCPHSCSVFQTEGDLGPERLKRDLLRDLNVAEIDSATNEMPILLAVLRYVMDNPH